MPSIGVHGHRGARGLRPENTLPGLAHAAGLGVDAIEFDVGLTADGDRAREDAGYSQPLRRKPR